jgi:hypothetical protein
MQLQTLRSNCGWKMVLKPNWKCKWKPTEVKLKIKVANLNEKKRQDVRPGVK